MIFPPSGGEGHRISEEQKDPGDGGVAGDQEQEGEITKRVGGVATRRLQREEPSGQPEAPKGVQGGFVRTPEKCGGCQGGIKVQPTLVDF